MNWLTLSTTLLCTDFRTWLMFFTKFTSLFGIQNVYYYYSLLTRTDYMFLGPGILFMVYMVFGVIFAHNLIMKFLVCFFF